MVQQHPDEKAIFKVAFNIESTDARDEYLRQVCGDQPELFQRVQTLLHRHNEAPSFLESPPSGLMATVQIPSQLSSQIPSQSSSQLEGPGTCIGPYKLRELLGEGGMGSVYVAEQEKPLRRKVAVKVIKPGMDSREVISRFEAERQALALMDHANIAKVLDAGTTAASRPYFVMELVKGLTITEHCDQHKLGTRQRLQLFLQVCQAVQHAHQKGIIHRDLKPSNVIVTMRDTVPVVKVIDFGVAKAIGQQLTEHTLYTGFSQMIGTPLYMSPEQAGQSCIDIDTRSDIYSLGVMLYELLTGCTPFATETLKQVGIDEMRRMIREVDPPRPSERISTLNAAALSTIAESRYAEPRQLRKQLRGELDWIVMKALEKDRNRRYETANGLAADVQRYLNDEPVQACPPSASYRFRKFVRRNKVALTSAAVLLLVAGSVLLATTLVAIGQRRVAFSLQELTQRRLAVQEGINAALAEIAELRHQTGAAVGGGYRDTETRIRDQLNRALALTQAEPTPPAVATQVQKLAKELEDLSRDRQLLDALDEAWIAQANTNPNDARWAPEQCIPRLSKALATRGIMPGETPPEQAAAGIRGMPEKLRAPVLVALEEWARCRTINPGVTVRPIADESTHASDALIKTESTQRGFLGVRHNDLGPDRRESYGFTGKDGVLITDVSRDGPADKSGPKAGDIVTKLDGKPLTNSLELSKTVAAMAPGTVVEFEVFRDGLTQSMPVNLGVSPGFSLSQRSIGSLDTNWGATVQW